MAHTSEQRDQHELCGAKKKNGELCRKFAGEGTEHFGVGRCRYHLGNTKAHKVHAVKEMAKQQAIEFGTPLPVEPTQALLSMVHLSAGQLAWIRQELSEIEDKQSFDGRVLMKMFSDERDRCARTAKMALDAGVAERSVRLAETYGELLARLIRGILDGLDLTPAQKLIEREVVRKNLMAIDEPPALTA